MLKNSLIPWHSISYCDPFDDVLWLRDLDQDPLIKIFNAKREWKQHLEVPGFTKSELKFDKDESTHKIIVYGKKVDAEDFFEVHRTLQVPKDVELNTINVEEINRGHLLFRAPLKPKQLNPHFGSNFSLRPTSARPGTMFTRLSESKAEIVPDEQNPDKQLVRADFKMSGFKPEEVSVTLNPDHNSVVMEGKRNYERKGDDMQVKTKSFKREEIYLPTNILQESITTKILPNGDLRFEAPVNTSAITTAAQ
jgi:HSP20 family molecular chaperone IbpA